MRVVLANKFLYPKGGAERAVLALGAELERRGHEVHYFGMAHPDNVVSGPQVEVVRRRDYRQPGPGRFWDAAAMVYSFEARRAFARLLRRVRPDVVHLHNIYHQITPSILDAIRTAGVAAVMTVHDYKLACPRYDMLRAGRPCDACLEDGLLACVRYRCAGSRLASALLAGESILHRARGSYDPVRLFLVPSRFLVRVLERTGYAAGRLRWLPNFAPVLAEPAATARAGRFLFAGRLSAEKGIETLVEAASRMGGGELVVCGEGPLGEALRAAAARAPAGRIVFRGHLLPADLATEIATATCTVVPSEWFENAPFAALESMALGRAVLGSRIGGIPEIVADGTTGLLVPAGDVEAWCNALERVRRDPAAAAAWGRAARDWVRAHRTLEAHATQLEEIYAEVAA